METEDVKAVVREKYGQAASRATAGARSSCCGSAASTDVCCDPITSNLYDTAQADEIPDMAMRASLGCGNPTALAELKAGEVVLDLGSGGGIDVLLSARRVGPTEGVRARHHGRDAGARGNEQARERADQRGVPEGRDRGDPAAGQYRGRHHLELRHQPVGRQGPRDFGSLSCPEAGRAARRLRRGRARVGASGDSQSMELWVGCVAGALGDYEYVAKLAKAGFEDIEIEPTRVYSVGDARTFLAGEGVDAEALATSLDGRFMSVFIRATKRAPAACCGTECCH